MQMRANAGLAMPPRRLLGARDGAQYMGLGETDFRTRYGHLAKRQGRRLVWDVLDLDAEADKLPYARVADGIGHDDDSFADWQP
jgi:hypothetical protein